MEKIKEIVKKRIKEKGQIKVSDITLETGYSRAYIQRKMSEMVRLGEISLIGRANKAIYVLGSKNFASKVLMREFKNKDLSEDFIWDRIKDETLFSDVSKKTKEIITYAFTEMLNNAIDHSKSEKINIQFEKDNNLINFNISDDGVGIFNNIRKKKKLKSDIEAIQDLMKGKQTTAPEAHSGEGIFFTSKIADKFIIYGSGHKIIFDNTIPDVFLATNPKRCGTRVSFSIKKDAIKNLSDVFNKYSDPETFKFTKTEIKVNLYKNDTVYISRSQARRILFGLGKFDILTLDFKGIKMIGQGFADEIFRVWANQNKKREVKYINASQEVEVMIKHATSE